MKEQLGDSSDDAIVVDCGHKWASIWALQDSMSGKCLVHAHSWAHKYSCENRDGRQRSDSAQIQIQRPDSAQIQIQRSDSAQIRVPGRRLCSDSQLTERTLYCDTALSAARRRVWFKTTDQEYQKILLFDQEYTEIDFESEAMPATGPCRMVKSFDKIWRELNVKYDWKTTMRSAVRILASHALTPFIEQSTKVVDRFVSQILSIWAAKPFVMPPLCAGLSWWGYAMRGIHCAIKSNDFRMNRQGLGSFVSFNVMDASLLE